MIIGAQLSLDAKHRFSLWRLWTAPENKPRVAWIMLNPSTADAETNDPTIRKCMKFSESWGYGGIAVVNLFSWRATDPRELKKHTLQELTDNGLSTEVLESVVQDVVRGGGIVVGAWGQHGKLYGRAASVKWRMEQLGIKLHALKLAKDGITPYHPLYLRDDSTPFPLR